MELVLSRELAERRVFPAIDIRASGARREDLLLSPKELDTACKLRRLMLGKLSAENLYSTIAKTQNNAELCERADEWLKIYNNDR